MNDRKDDQPRERGCYEIRLQGRLDQRWSTWFDGLDLTTDEDGTTVVRGPVADQAALHGLLARVRDLGVPLISLRRLDGRATAAQAPPPAMPAAGERPPTEPHLSTPFTERRKLP